MKKILFACILILSLILTGCANNTGNATTNDNGSNTSAPNSADTPTPPQTDESTPNDPEPNKPQSDTLPSGYFEPKATTTYHVYGQLGEPGDIITEIETPYAYHTFFVPTLPEQLTTLFDEHNLNYFCRYTAPKNAVSRECYLYAYDSHAEIIYTPSSGLFSERIYNFNAGIAITQSNTTPPIYITIIMSSAPERDNLITMQNYSDSTTIEFSDTTLSLGEEHIVALTEAINNFNP